MAGFPASYFCIKAFSETDQTEDLKKFDVPTLILHGDDDQIVPIGAIRPCCRPRSSRARRSKIIRGRAARHVHDPQGPGQRGPARVHQGVRPNIKEKYMVKLEGKIALITGGNSGIGLATAKQFVNEGAYVFITGRRDPELAAAVKEIGRNVTGVQGDVSNLGDLDRLFAQIKREKGKLDIVFANAGVAKYAPFGGITEEQYDSIFNINVKGLLFTVQKALPLLPDGASIILNASVVAQ